MTFGTRPYLVFSLLLALSVLPVVGQQQAPASQDVKTFQQLEDSWSVGYVGKDQYAMELLLSPTFLDISAAGGISTRNQYIAGIFGHPSGQVLSMQQRVVNVRVLGDVAVVDGTYVVHSRAVASPVEDERGIFTHVYQRTRANWVAVHAQRTAVFDQPETKQKQAGKKSNAPLPLHVPLLYPGAQPTPDKQPPQ
ncbi:MAG TPA: nuclear transport factor 2 family protein [Acidobacteriaceae bacterium]